MAVKSIVFALIAYGVAMLIALCVASIVKLVAIVVHRGKKSAPAASAKEKG